MEIQGGKAHISLKNTSKNNSDTKIRSLRTGQRAPLIKGITKHKFEEQKRRNKYVSAMN